MTPRILRAVDKRQPLQPMTSSSCVLLCRWLQNKHHSADSYRLANAAAFLFPQYLQITNRGRANALPLKAHLQLYIQSFFRRRVRRKNSATQAPWARSPVRTLVVGDLKGEPVPPLRVFNHFLPRFAWQKILCIPLVYALAHARCGMKGGCKGGSPFPL